MKKTLVPIHIVPVNVVHGWLVSSKDKRWHPHWSEFFPSSKRAAIAYAKKRALQLKGGSVKIHTKSGRIAEERTYPRSRDPRRSKG